MLNLSTRSKGYSRSLENRICYVTEADLDRHGVGGVVTDQQMLSRLKELANVDVIYLRRITYRSTPLALLVFFFQILSSFSKRYAIYFSRGLIASSLLVSFNMMMSKKRRIIKRALSVPFASEEVEFLKYGRVESFLRYSLFLFLQQYVYPRVDFVTVAAESYKRQMIEAGVRDEKIHVVSFNVGEEYFSQPLKSQADRIFNFCYVGGFHRYQDLLPVLAAFEIVSKSKRDVRLILVGDGPQHPELQEEATKRGLRKRVEFVGVVPHASLPLLLHQIDCFISVTRKPGLSISILEAAATGKAIITFVPKNELNYGGCFRHKKEIYLVNSVSPDEIAQAMELLHENSSLRNRIAQGAREVAQKHFSEKVTRKQLEKLLLKIS